MKKIFQPLLYVAIIATSLWSCSPKDKVDPTLNTFGIENYDLIQVTNTAPYVPLTIEASDDTGLDKLDVKITADGNANVKPLTLAMNNITSKEPGRFVVNVPFPLPSEAPSGVYNVNYTLLDKKGKSTSKSFKVSIVNSRAPSTPSCELDKLESGTVAPPALPAGKNCWVYLEAPDYHDGSDVYIVGGFGGANGGADWSPAQDIFKMEKLSNRCFRIALNFSAGHSFKFTLSGGWSTQVEKADGSDSSDEPWNGKALQVSKVDGSANTARFRGKLPPTSIPAAAIKQGMITVLIDVNSTDDSKPYYLVKKGATAVTDANKMFRMLGTRNMAIAVPKEAGAEYMIVRETIAKIGQNSYGFDRTFLINGVTNPVNGGVSGFKTEFTAQAVPTNLFAVGDATPGVWNNPVPVPSQQFTLVSAGKFEIASLAITGSKEMLLLPVNGSWDAKYGLPSSATGPTTTGDVVPGGQNIKGPADSGNYKITVDFTLGTYTFTRL
jgi:hypothetical protein